MTQHPWGEPVRPSPALVDPPVRLPRREPRRITQLCDAVTGVLALCDDGTVWEFSDGSWFPLPSIPQRQLAEDV